MKSKAVWLSGSMLLWLCQCLCGTAFAADANQPLAVLPFEMEGEFIFLKVGVGQSTPLDFIFDTGAGTTVINARASEALGLQATGSRETSGAGGDFTVDTIRSVKLSVGGLDLGRKKVQSTSLLHLEQAIGRRIDGIIGFHVLRKRVVSVDHDAQELRIYTRRGYKYAGVGQQLPIRAGSHAAVSAQLQLPDGQTLSSSFLLDSGAGIALGVSTPFIRKHEILATIENGYERTSLGYSTSRSKVYRTRLPLLKIGPSQFSRVPSSLYEVSEGFFSEDEHAGVIGNVVLRRFNIVFDYAGNRSWWTPNERYAAPSFAVDGSGLTLRMDPALERVAVEKVQEDSPAQQAGLLAGDELLAVDELQACASPLYKLEARLRHDGRTVQIRYRRTGAVRELSLGLSALL